MKHTAKGALAITLVLVLILATGITFADVNEMGLNIFENETISSLNFQEASEGRILFYDNDGIYGYTDYEGNIVFLPSLTMHMHLVQVLQR